MQIERRKAILDDLVPKLGDHVRVSAVLDARLKTIVPKLKKMKDAVWVKPVKRAEVEFVEWTTSGKLRHALFRRLVES